MFIERNGTGNLFNKNRKYVSDIVFSGKSYRQILQLVNAIMLH